MKLATRKLAVIGMLGSISIILGAAGIGIIQLPFLPVQVTIMHIPTIIGAIVEGPIVGLFIGLIFGGFSMYQAFTRPVGLSIAFMDPLVAIIPRLLIPLVSYYSYRCVGKIFKPSFKRRVAISAMIATALGTFTNTVGVLGMIFLRYKHVVAEMLNVDKSVVGKAIVTVIAIPNGVPEIIFAVLITIPIIQGLQKFYKHEL